MQHPGRVFTREQLLDAVWGRDIHVEPRTVDVHVRRLRKAINGPGETGRDPHGALRRLCAGPRDRLSARGLSSTLAISRL